MAPKMAALQTVATAVDYDILVYTSRENSSAKCKARLIPKK
jgi:hypothetical protein